jgi:hypothetical protein
MTDATLLSTVVARVDHHMAGFGQKLTGMIETFITNILVSATSCDERTRDVTVPINV